MNLLLPDEGHGFASPLQALLERCLGRSMSGVRVHAGDRALPFDAKAFAWGNDVFFSPGEFRLDTESGRFLLGHELQHVIQQREGRVRNPFARGVALVHDDALEEEADEMGRRLAGLEADWPVASVDERAELPPYGCDAGCECSVIQALRIGKIPTYAWRQANIVCYAEYDALAIASNLQHDVKDFSDGMRKMIRRENKAYAATNGFNANPLNAGAGKFLSDETNLQLWRKKGLLNLLAEVDHVIEYQFWGCNDYRNARVLSAQENVGLVTRPGPNDILVISMDTVDDVNGSGVDAESKEPLTYQELNVLLTKARQRYNQGRRPAHLPTHYNGNPLANVGQMTDNDFFAIYVNLEQE